MSKNKTSRRNFIKSTICAGLASAVPVSCSRDSKRKTAYDVLNEAASKPVLKRVYFAEPVIIKSLELLHYDGNYILRTVSQNGATGYSVSNNAHMKYLFPLLLMQVAPYFIGKDARDLDNLIDEVYVFNSNYKLQGLALWITVATVEFALLDLLGKIAQKPLGELIGNVLNRKISVYQANNYRGKSAEESIEGIKENVEKTGSKALKVKIGGRMSKDADFPPGRSKKLIPLVRKTFGEKMVIYADSNGSYSVEKAIEIGRLLEKYNYDFFEEPVPFDWFEETRQVAEALNIPIAGGEQETSLHRFRWLLANNALQIVQPDLFYFGGMIRSTRVARMAQAADIRCTPHISGSGLGHVYMVHFVSTLTNAGPYHEYKGVNKEIRVSCGTSSLRSEEGEVTVPSSPGLGVAIDPDFLAKHEIVRI